MCQRREVIKDHVAKLIRVSRELLDRILKRLNQEPCYEARHMLGTVHLILGVRLSGSQYYNNLSRVKSTNKVADEILSTKSRNTRTVAVGFRGALSRAV